VIGEDGSGLSEPFKVVAVPIHGLNNGQHLLIVDLIVELCRVEFAAVEGDGVQPPRTRVSLRYNGANGVVRGIRL